MIRYSHGISFESQVHYHTILHFRNIIVYVTEYWVSYLEKLMSFFSNAKVLINNIHKIIIGIFSPLFTDRNVFSYKKQFIETAFAVQSWIAALLSMICFMTFCLFSIVLIFTAPLAALALCFLNEYCIMVSIINTEIIMFFKRVLHYGIHYQYRNLQVVSSTINTRPKLART